MPTAAHNSFQPYKALDISVNKKTNHAFPGRTRQMTRSPTMEDKDSGQYLIARDQIVTWYLIAC